MKRVALLAGLAVSLTLAASCSSSPGEPPTAQPPTAASHGDASASVTASAVATAAPAAPAPITFDNSRVVQAVEWNPPWVNVEPTQDGGAMITVALRPLAEKARALSLVLSDETDASFGGLVDRECSDGKVITEIDRAVFEVGSAENLSVQFRVGSPLLDPSRGYALLTCVRDADGALSRDVQSMASTFRPGENDGLHVAVSTPSGPVELSNLQAGHQVLSWDEKAGKLVVRSASYREGSASDSVRITLADGRTIDTPGDRTFFVSGPEEYRPASALVYGDVLISDTGRPITVQRVAETEDGFTARVDVSGGSGAFIGGVLAKDPPLTKAKTKGKGAKRVHEEVVAPDDARPYASAKQADLSVEAAPISYDCFIDSTLSVRQLSADIRHVALVVRTHQGKAGLVSETKCSEKAAAKVDRALLERIAAIPGVRAELGVRVDDLECDAGYALGVCVDRGAALEVAAGTQSVYGQSGVSCLVGGTPIATPHGDVAIEKLSPGDIVFAFDPETQKRTLTRVVRLKAREDRKVDRLVFSDGTEIRATPEHPFFVVDGGFLTTKELPIGGSFLGLDGSTITLKSRVADPDATTVYDLSVEAPHTYYAAGVVVHNY